MQDLDIGKWPAERCERGGRRSARQWEANGEYAHDGGVGVAGRVVCDEDGGG